MEVEVGKEMSEWCATISNILTISSDTLGVTIPHTWHVLSVVVGNVCKVLPSGSIHSIGESLNEMNT